MPKGLAQVALFASLLGLVACKEDFPKDRAEACMVTVAQKSTQKLLGAGSMLLSLSNDPKVRDYDVGSVTLDHVNFGDCTTDGSGSYACMVEYEVVLQGEGGKALAKLSTSLGAPIEGKRLEKWGFRFGPTLTDCGVQS